MCRMGNTIDIDVWMQELCIGKFAQCGMLLSSLSRTRTYTAGQMTVSVNC